MMDKIRTIKLFKNYYKEFYVAQTKTVRDKINSVLRLVETQRMFPKKCLFLNSLDSFHRFKLNCLSTSYTSY